MNNCRQILLKAFNNKKLTEEDIQTIIKRTKINRNDLGFF